MEAPFRFRCFVGMASTTGTRIRPTTGGTLGID
jgi:hypothetical protein